MQKLIDASQKMTSLLIEYREAMIYEKCLWHVVPQTDRFNWFFLIEIKSGTIKIDGTPDKIKSFLRIRKIQPETVYQYDKLFNNENLR